MADVFISYSKSDRSYALDLAEELRARGISVWIDQTSIGGAKNWAAEIVEAINACSTMLCLLSPHSIASENVAREVQLASEKQKQILPVLLESVTLPPKLEYPLAGLQRVFLRDRQAIFHALHSISGALAIEELPNTSVTDSIRVAVLPFDDLSPEHDNQWFADGMMDELISTLGSIEHVKVPPRSDVLHYRDHKKKSRDIAREMGVRYLIEGGVRKAKDKIRINASLTDALRGEQIWTNKYDGSFDDVFEFQESVSRQITEALRLKLTPKEEAKLEAQPTQNAEAYELYLRGREQQYLLTKEGYLKAMELYEQAIKLDPKFANAYIALASVCNVYYREYSREPKWLKRAQKNIELAKRITGETADTQWLLGEVEWMRGNYHDAATILNNAAIESPRSYKIFNTLGSLYMITGEYEKAAEAFQKELEIRETTLDFFNLLIALNATGEKDRLKATAIKAIPVFERHLSRVPQDQTAQFHFAVVLHRAGRENQALNLAHNLLQMNNLSGHALYNLGCFYDELGKPEYYVHLLRKAIVQGYREIEQTRNYDFTTKDPECEAEFKKIVAELEAIIAEEKNRKEEPETIM